MKAEKHNFCGLPAPSCLDDSAVEICCQEKIAPNAPRHSTGFVVLSFNEITLLIKVHLPCIDKIDLISPTPNAVRMSVAFPQKIMTHFHVTIKI